MSETAMTDLSPLQIKNILSCIFQYEVAQPKHKFYGVRVALDERGRRLVFKDAYVSVTKGLDGENKNIDTALYEFLTNAGVKKAALRNEDHFRRQGNDLFVSAGLLSGNPKAIENFFGTLKRGYILDYNFTNTLQKIFESITANDGHDTLSEEISGNLGMITYLVGKLTEASAEIAFTLFKHRVENLHRAAELISTIPDLHVELSVEEKAVEPYLGVGLFRLAVNGHIHHLMVDMQNIQLIREGIGLFSDEGIAFAGFSQRMKPVYKGAPKCNN